MPINEPNLLLSKDDREALALLGHLVLSAYELNSNSSPELVALSPREAQRLLRLLEQFAASRQFVEGAYFAEGLANGDAWNDDGLREIYLSQRKRRGQSRIASSTKWRDLVVRAGFNTKQEAWVGPSDFRRAPTRPMTLEHFLAMEARLVSLSSLHPRVGELVLNLTSEAIPKLAEIREQKRKIEKGSLRRFVADFIYDLSHHIEGNEKRATTRRRIVAMSTLLMDTGAMFATRDWTAAGVLSSLAAVVSDSID
jgi:hypothetical protein